MKATAIAASVAAVLVGSVSVNAQAATAARSEVSVPDAWVTPVRTVKHKHRVVTRKTTTRKVVRHHRHTTTTTSSANDAVPLDTGK